jgi:hypothetical protein
MERRKYGVCPAPALKRAVARLIKERGLRAAAKALGLREQPTSRLAVGEQVLEATLVVAASSLKKLSTAGEAA